MTSLISNVHAKASAFATKAHQAVKSHTLTIVYLAILGAVAIPVGHMVWDYWAPVVLAGYKSAQSQNPFNNTNQARTIPAVKK